MHAVEHADGRDATVDDRVTGDGAVDVDVVVPHLHLAAAPFRWCQRRNVRGSQPLTAG
jgi:hypothetical protein